MKILVGVDGSERSLAAVRFACRLVKPQNAQFTLMYVPPSRLLRHAGKALAESILNDAVGSLPAEGRENVEVIVGDRKPGPSLLGASQQLRADLIVVGAHSEKRHLPFFTGSVARSIAHGSHSPVLVVRHPPVTENMPLKILLAHCATAACDKATAVLDRLDWPGKIEASVMHVVESVEGERLRQLARTRPGAFEASKVIAEYQQGIQNEKSQTWAGLQRMQSTLPAIFRGRDPLVEEGHVVETIVRVVQAQEFQLVAVGARRLGPVSRLLGSTSAGLLSHCPCSLLIAHADDFA